MKPVSLILTLVVTLLMFGCVSQTNVPKESSDKVLLIIREKMVVEHLASNEVFVMKSMLEEAGFKVVVASASGRTFVRNNTTLESDLKLADVKVADYVGFIIPCMDIGKWTIHPEAVVIVKQAVAGGKPVAAQRKGILVLGQAGALAGKRYAFLRDFRLVPRSDDAIYSGTGVIQDGKIITSAVCPRRAEEMGLPEGTVELTQLLIAELQK